MSLPETLLEPDTAPKQKSTKPTESEEPEVLCEKSNPKFLQAARPAMWPHWSGCCSNVQTLTSACRTCWPLTLLQNQSSLLKRKVSSICVIVQSFMIIFILFLLEPCRAGFQCKEFCTGSSSTESSTIVPAMFIRLKMPFDVC